MTISNRVEVVPLQFHLGHCVTTVKFYRRPLHQFTLLRACSSQDLPQIRHWLAITLTGRDEKKQQLN
jgi:hypothetical protein